MKKDHPKIKKIKKIKQQHNQESHHPQSDHQPNLDTKNTHKIQPKSTSNNPPSHPKTTLLNQQKPIQKQHQNPVIRRPLPTIQNPPPPTLAYQLKALKILYKNNQKSTTKNTGTNYPNTLQSKR